VQRYLLSRLVQTVITLFVVSLVVFFLVRLRGDPVTVMAPPTFNEQQIQALRRAWGLDQPLWRQYVVFLGNAVTGDFGMSRQYNRPAMGLVIERLQWTLLLAATSSVVGLLIALPLGIVSALKRNSVIDLVSTMFATLGTAMPSFWVGLMLILLFSVQLRLLPAFGADTWTAAIMPTIALGTGMAARISRLTRSSMLEVLGQDYVRTARSKGLMYRTVVFRHALRNALIPVLTAFGLQLGWLLGGTVTVEVVFAWPGVGRLMVEAIGIRDITVVQAGLFWIALSFLLINLIVDVLYTYIDPRISYS
jgi:peptide/nickel transport system permease protein